MSEENITHTQNYKTSSLKGVCEILLQKSYFDTPVLGTLLENWKVQTTLTKGVYGFIRT